MYSSQNLRDSSVDLLTHVLINDATEVRVLVTMTKKL